MSGRVGKSRDLLGYGKQGPGERMGCGGKATPQVPLERHSEDFSLGPVSTRPLKDWHGSNIQKVKIKENDIELVFSLVFLIEF